MANIGKIDKFGIDVGSLRQIRMTMGRHYKVEQHYRPLPSLSPGRPPAGKIKALRFR